MTDKPPSGRTLDPALRFHRGLLAPRYWGTWLILLFLWLVMFLPRSWMMRLGGLLGDRFRNKNQKRRRIVEVNLQLCFPDKSEQEREAMCVEHFRVYCRCLLDSGLSMFGSARRVKSLVDFDAGSLEQHAQLIRDDKVVVVPWHLATMEIGGNILSFAGPAVSMMKPMNNALLTWITAWGRTRLANVELVTRESGMRRLLKGMKNGRQCVLFPDEDLPASDKGATFVPFFGVERSMLTTPGRLALSAGAKIVTCAARLDSLSGRYHFSFGAPLKATDYDTPESVAAAISAAMEELLRDMPEHYMWTFRWFRSRPDGSPSPYDPVPQS